MKVATCCGCCSLKTGTIITGAVEIVLCVISLILNFTTDILEEEVIKTDILQEEARKTDNLGVNTVKATYAAGYCVGTGICTLLIIGALKKNTCLMLPWLILGVIEIVGLCVEFLTVSIVSFINNKILNGFLWLILGLITTAIHTYLWLVVYNYRNELLEMGMGTIERSEEMSMGTAPYENPPSYEQVAVQK